MSLTKLLVGIGVTWVVLGSWVLGANLLIYPAAWMTIMAFFFGLHQVVGTKVSATEISQETSPEPQAATFTSPAPTPVPTPAPALQTAE